MGSNDRGDGQKTEVAEIYTDLAARSRGKSEAKPSSAMLTALPINQIKHLWRPSQRKYYKHGIIISFFAPRSRGLGIISSARYR